MRAWIVGLLVCLCAQPALAGWEFLETWIDPFTGAELRAATSTSDAGVALHLYRLPSGRVYALISLPEGGASFAAAGVIGQITPEGFKTKDIEVRDEPGRIVEYSLSTGRMLRARLWHGQGQAPAFGTLRDIIDTTSLNASFRLADNSTLDTAWSMEGASLPIAQALGIKIEGVAAGEEWEDMASQALMAAMTACQFPKLDMMCIQHVTKCSAKISDDRDIDGFEVCVSDGN